MDEYVKNWEAVLNKLEMMVSAVSFDLWIKPLELLEFKNGSTLVLGASSTTAKNQILKNHADKLSECILDVFGEGVGYEILDQNEKQEYLKDTVVVEPAVEAREEHPNKGMFNSKYTFDNFVVGKSNQFVYAAARAVAEHPGQKFNPLFIYGGVGLGKTHLLHAIGNYIHEHMPDLKIMYATCEKFTNDYIESLRSNKENETIEFREKYRNLDVLMIDDIQFISNKTSTQEEFFHTFNELYQNNKQIIISSDRPPKEIATLEERLSSRFTCGLIQDIQSPDFETRVAILRKKSQQERYLIDDEVIEFIAEKVDTNIREMEGILSKVVFYSGLQGKTHASMDDAREALKDYGETERTNLDANKIIGTVCDFFKISKDDLIGKKKNKEIVEPRQLCIYLINDMLNIPLTAIGDIMGGRDHTTIMHARDKISKQYKTNPHIKTLVNDIKSRLLKY